MEEKDRGYGPKRGALEPDTGGGLKPIRGWV